MATRLFSILRFSAVGAGAQATLPHQINLDDRGVVPDEITVSNGDFSVVSVTATDVTVENTSGFAADTDVLCRRWDPFMRAFGIENQPSLTPQPFVPAAGGGSIPLSNANPTTIEPDDAAAPGTALAASRADHQHAIDADAAANLAAGDTPAEGASTSFARADHQHGVPVAAPVAIADSANAGGAAATFSRSDHVHAHGDRTGGTLHAVATPATAGFMSAADKTKLNSLPTTSGGAILGWGNNDVGTATTTRFLDSWWSSRTAPSSDDRQRPLARAGTLRNLVVRHGLAGGNGNSVVYTVLVNGVATAITVTLATGAVGQAPSTRPLSYKEIEFLCAPPKALSPGGGALNVTATLEFV
jgi:hypothetical protein